MKDSTSVRSAAHKGVNDLINFVSDHLAMLPALVTLHEVQRGEKPNYVCVLQNVKGRVI